MISRFKNKLYNVLLCIILIIFLHSYSSNTSTNYIVDNGFIFNTTYTIKYQYKYSLKSEIENELALFDKSLNPFNPNSIISKVNKNQKTELDTFFLNVFNESQLVASKTNGLFDITVSPLINAWGFGFEHINDVTPDVIDSLKQIVGYDKISLQNGKILKKDNRITINTSAIAKGYSVDVIANLLDSYNIDNYMVEIGGEIRVKGTNEEEKYWNIGIDIPFDNKYSRDELIYSIELCDKSLATSGNYRNYYMKDGEKISHTINPHTGYPSESRILSATVIAKDCMTADAYATAFMIADIPTIEKIAKEENLSYILIIADENDLYKTIVSSDLVIKDKKISWKNGIYEFN